VSGAVNAALSSERPRSEQPATGRTAQNKAMAERTHKPTGEQAGRAERADAPVAHPLFSLLPGQALGPAAGQAGAFLLEDELSRRPTVEAGTERCNELRAAVESIKAAKAELELDDASSDATTPPKLRKRSHSVSGLLVASVGQHHAPAGQSHSPTKLAVVKLKSQMDMLVAQNEALQKKVDELPTVIAVAVQQALDNRGLGPSSHAPPPPSPLPSAQVASSELAA
jgi:hypothetical protein